MKVKCRICKEMIEEELCYSEKRYTKHIYMCKVCSQRRCKEYRDKKLCVMKEVYIATTQRRQGESFDDYAKRWNEENPLREITREDFMHNSSSFVNAVSVER